MLSVLKRQSQGLFRNTQLRYRFDLSPAYLSSRLFASKPIIGIDFGGNSSSVAYHDGSTCKVITNPEGSRTTPSVVSWVKSKEGATQELVGRGAKKLINTNPKSSYSNFKRLLGRDFSDAETQELISNSNYSFDLTEISGNALQPNHCNIGLICEATNDVKTPEQVASVILARMKSTAENYLSDAVNDCVLTVPSNFTQTQRESLTEAAKIAGLRVKDLIEDAHAAAIAYNLGRVNVDIVNYAQASNPDAKGDKDSTKATNMTGELDEPGTLVAVYDLGGSTFNFTVLRTTESGELETLSHEHTPFLGGNNFDDLLVRYICDEFYKETDCKLEDPMTLERVRECAETAKIELSHKTPAEINAPFITADATGPKHILMDLSRAKYESLTAKLMQDTMPYVQRALEAAEITDPKQVQHVLLCGGMTRTPKVQEMVCKYFGQSVALLSKRYDEVLGDVSNDELQSYGAASYAYWLQNCQQRTSGAEGAEEGAESEAIGADDVLDLAIGVEVMGNQFYTILESSTTFPCQVTERFTIAYNGQNALNLKVWMGNQETLLISHRLADAEDEEDDAEDAEDADETDDVVDEENDEMSEDADEADETEEMEMSQDNDNSEDAMDENDENENSDEFDEEDDEMIPSHLLLGEVDLKCNDRHNGLVSGNVVIEATFELDQFGALTVTARDVTEYDTFDGLDETSVRFEEQVLNVGDVKKRLERKQIWEYLRQSRSSEVEEFIGNTNGNWLDMERQYLNNKADMVVWQSEIELTRYAGYLENNNKVLKEEMQSSVDALRQLRNMSELDNEARDKECNVTELNAKIQHLMLLNQQLNDFLFGFVEPSVDDSDESGTDASDASEGTGNPPDDGAEAGDAEDAKQQAKSGSDSKSQTL